MANASGSPFYIRLFFCKFIACHTSSTMHKTLLVTLLFYWLAGHEILFAQNQSTVVTTIPFKQLTFEEKRVKILTWINQSQSLRIPQPYDEAFRTFFIQNGQGEAIYEKYKVILRVPFNPALALQDRIHVCEFMLENYQAGDLPMADINTYMEDLIQLNNNR